MIEVRVTSIFENWLDSLRDRRARNRIQARIDRLSFGNFGDTRWLRDGVGELRVDYGPGYRIYFARRGDAIVILLCGGDKRTQSADIVRAKKAAEEMN